MTDTREHQPLGGRILIAEGDTDDAHAFNSILSGHGHTVIQVSTGAEALEVIGGEAVDLVIIGTVDGDLDGIETCRRIRNNRHKSRLPIIFVTSEDEKSHRIEAKDTGADDFLLKPVDETELTVRVRNLVLVGRYYRTLEKDRASLRRTVEEQNDLLTKAMVEIGKAQQALRKFNEEIIFRLSKAVEYRDDEIGNHVQRMSRYCGIIAARTGMSTEMCDAIRIAAALHDVGKIAIPDDILRKPGRLTDEEMSVMRQHAEKGYNMLEGSSSSLLELAAIIARSHHERFDGRGYPRGLSAKEIPFEGRVAAVADVFDALTSKRVYKPAFPIPKAQDILLQESGTAFDPDIVEAFMDSFDDVRNVMIVYADR